MAKPISQRRIFTMGDAGYFLGIVALINSLRITGNNDPVTVLDLGMTPEQRTVLAPHCEFIEIDMVDGMKPWVLAPFPQVVDPEGLIAIIDSDIIITASLDPFFEQAERAQVVVFPDPWYTDRQFDSWESDFGLGAPLRTGQAYANAGCIFFSTLAQPDFLRRWWECCVKVAGTKTMLDDGDEASPFAYGSQDALNALLMSEVSPTSIAYQPKHAERFLDLQRGGVEFQNLERLECMHEGELVSVLHRFMSNKPWQRSARRAVVRTAYLMGLRRCLVGPGLEIRVSRHELPPWLLPGVRGRVALELLCHMEHVRNGVRWMRQLRYRTGRAVKIRLATNRFARAIWKAARGVDR